MECIICAYKFNSFDRIPAVTECDHNNVCGFCFLRMRALQKNYSCPTCKRDLEYVICTDKKDASYGQFTIWGESIGEDYMLDQKSRMFVPKKFSKSTVEPLWICKCNSCHQTRRDLKSLRGHLTAEHNLHLCMLCAENKQAFPAEQKIYTQAQYEKHLRKGDGDGSSGHPNCEFCRKRFYDSTALFMHLNKDHYTCHLCERMGIKFKYYNNYKDVENHYRKDHFLCEERACLEKQFIAFANEIDMAAHNMTWHPSLQGIARRSAIPVSFKTRRSEQSSSQGTGGRNSGGNDAEGAGEETAGGESSAARGAFEGGLGGRAVDGEWQVQLQPLGAAADPRDPLRNTNSTMAVESFLVADAVDGQQQATEDFPALQSSSSAAPIGSFYAGVATNRWVGIGGANSDGRVGGKKKSDFPALKSSAAAKGKLSAADREKLGLQPKQKQHGSSPAAQQLGNVSSINSEYAAAATTTGASPLGSLASWGTVKVDKRLQHTKKPSTSSAKSESNAVSNVSTGGLRGASAASSEQESVDLALALSASMATTANTPAQAPAGPAASWVKVEAKPAAVAATSSAFPPPAPSMSEDAFPGLLASTSSSSSDSAVPAAGGAPKKKMAPPAVNKNLLDMTSMLRAAGVSGAGGGPKAAPKLTVVKTKKQPAVSPMAAAVNWAAPPPPPVSVQSLTRIGKSSNDNLASLGGDGGGDVVYKASGGSSSSREKKYGGWVKIGGAGADDNTAATTRNIDNAQYPTLGGSSR